MTVHVVVFAKLFKTVLFAKKLYFPLLFRKKIKADWY